MDAEGMTRRQKDKEGSSERHEKEEGGDKGSRGKEEKTR